MHTLYFMTYFVFTCTNITGNYKLVHNLFHSSNVLCKNEYFLMHSQHCSFTRHYDWMSVAHSDELSSHTELNPSVFILLICGPNTLDIQTDRQSDWPAIYQNED